jgi:hypothetical protein
MHIYQVEIVCDIDTQSAFSDLSHPNPAVVNSPFHLDGNHFQLSRFYRPADWDRLG